LVKPEPPKPKFGELLALTLLSPFLDQALNLEEEEAKEEEAAAQECVSP
jgi:hypothetical protein